MCAFLRGVVGSINCLRNGFHVTWNEFYAGIAKLVFICLGCTCNHQSKYNGLQFFHNPPLNR